MFMHDIVSACNSDWLVCLIRNFVWASVRHFMDLQSSRLQCSLNCRYIQCTCIIYTYTIYTTQEAKYSAHSNMTVSTLKEELPALVDCPDPDHMTPHERRVARLAHEEASFDPDHYLWENHCCSSSYSTVETSYYRVKYVLVSGRVLCAGLIWWSVVSRLTVCVSSSQAGTRR